MFIYIIVLERGFFGVERLPKISAVSLGMDSHKKKIFEKCLKARTVSDKDWAFCGRIDWHPVDELPLKEEFKKEIEKRKKGPFLKFNSVDEIFKH